MAFAAAERVRRCSRDPGAAAAPRAASRPVAALAATELGALADAERSTTRRRVTDRNIFVELKIIRFQQT
jgi:hypothetical protein